MKRQLGAIALAGAFCGVTHADDKVTVLGVDVTVYGIATTGVMSASRSGPTGAAGSVTAYSDSQLNPSVFGFKGSVDPGNGLKAGFELEGGISTSNGAVGNEGDGGIFGRRANAFLGGDWGTFTAGLQLDPAWIAMWATDARGSTDSFSGSPLWIFTTAANTDSMQAGLFDTRSLSYRYEGHGLTVSALYGVGGVSGHTSANSQQSVGAAYKNDGFTVSAGFVQGRSSAISGATAGISSQIDFAGVGYAVGAFALRAQYNELKSHYQFGQAANDLRNLNLGLDYVTGPNTVNLSFYHVKDAGAAFGGKTIEVALLDKYALLKRVTVFAQLVNVKSDANAGGSAEIANYYTPSGGPVGATATYIGAGMEYAF